MLCLVFSLGAAGTLAQEADAADNDAEAKTAASPKERVSISLGLNHSALAVAFPDQAVWLETDDHGRTLVLFEPERTEKAKGAVLILGDEGQGAHTKLTGALREPLVRAGWAAMSMGLAQWPLSLAQARHRMEEQARAGGPVLAPEQSDEASGKDDKEPESEAVMIDVMTNDTFESQSDKQEAKVQAYLAAALAELGQRGYQRLVLIGVGRGAGPVARQAIAGGEGDRSVVWIAPQFGPAELKALTQQLEATGPVPLLELTSSRGARKSADARVIMMKRRFFTAYTQQPVAMSSPPKARNAGQLVGRVAAWLSD